MVMWLGNPNYATKAAASEERLGSTTLSAAPHRALLESLASRDPKVTCAGVTSANRPRKSALADADPKHQLASAMR